jgi:hypothetical protein
MFWRHEEQYSFVYFAVAIAYFMVQVGALRVLREFQPPSFLTPATILNHHKFIRIQDAASRNLMGSEK